MDTALQLFFIFCAIGAGLFVCSMLLLLVLKVGVPVFDKIFGVGPNDVQEPE